MRKTEFENGSAIETIPSKECKCGIVRGRKLTDIESKHMQELEIIKAEERIDKIIERLRL